MHYIFQLISKQKKQKDLKGLVEQRYTCPGMLKFANRDKTPLGNMT